MFFRQFHTVVKDLRKYIPNTNDRYINIYFHLNFNKFKILKHQLLSQKLTPEELLNKQVQEFNKGNISFLMTLYENEACFAPRVGEVVKDLDSIRRSLQDIIAMGGKLEAEVKRILHASDLALVITEWSIKGAIFKGRPIKLSGRGIIVLRQQSDGTWLMVLENPWGTE